MSHLLATAAAKSEVDGIEAAYDAVFERIQAGDWPCIDELLGVLDPSLFQDSVLLSVLTATALSEVRKHLPARSAFHERVSELLAERNGPLQAADLLQGLE